MVGAIPHCKHCGAVARPGILKCKSLLFLFFFSSGICLFDDLHWVGKEEKFEVWVSALKKKMNQDKKLKLAIIEIGCGDRVPTIRTHNEDLLAKLYSSGLLWEDERKGEGVRAKLIRVNPDEKLSGIVRKSAEYLAPYVISVKMGAEEALNQILK